MKYYAYARVSARDQNLDRQILEFIKFGIPKDQIYTDKKSGRDFDRAGYRRLVRRLRAGDLLVIKSIDRLGRSYDAIIREWSRITGELGADILVLDMPLLDTREKSGTLVGRFISDLVLQILSFVAENERQNIKARQAEGIAAAKQRGVRFGRPAFVYTENFLDALDKCERGELTLTEASNLVGMKPNAFSYHLKKSRERRSVGLPSPVGNEQNAR